MIGFITLCVKRHICLVKQVTQTIIFCYHKRMDCRVIQKLEKIVNVMEDAVRFKCLDVRTRLKHNFQ